MIYLKRFLYLLITSILYSLTIPIAILYVVFIPLGLTISFISAGEFTKYFAPLVHLEEYLEFIDDKLEYIFLK